MRTTSVALHLGLEGAADAAVGAGGDDAVLRLAVLDDGLLHQRRGRAGLHAGAAGDAFGVEEGFDLAGRHGRGEAAAVDGQREGALHFLAGAHAARADDALRRVEGEVRVGLVLLGLRGGSRRHSRSAPRAGRPRRPCPAARSRRWRRRSGSRADGRRCRAPSRRGAASPSCGGLGAAPSCRARPAWCRRRACRGGPRSRPGRGGRSRRRSRLSVAQSFGTLMPASTAARMTEVPAGTRDGHAVDLQRHRRVASGAAGRAVVDFLDQR